MKLRYEANKGQRIKYMFMGVCAWGFWWLHKTRKWVGLDEANSYKEDYGSHAPCKSVRAFKRMLRKHPQIKGQAVLVSRYVGHSVHG